MSLRRNISRITVGTLVVASMGAVFAAPASAAGVYVCYSATEDIKADYPGILGGGNIVTLPAPDGVQTTRCANGGAGADLPIGVS